MISNRRIAQGVREKIDFQVIKGKKITILASEDFAAHFLSLGLGFFCLEPGRFVGG